MSTGEGSRLDGNLLIRVSINEMNVLKAAALIFLHHFGAYQSLRLVLQRRTSPRENEETAKKPNLYKLIHGRISRK